MTNPIRRDSRDAFDLAKLARDIILAYDPKATIKFPVRLDAVKYFCLRNDNGWLDPVHWNQVAFRVFIGLTREVSPA